MILAALVPSMKRIAPFALAASALLNPLTAGAQQSSPAWQKIGDVGTMVMEVDPASHRANGNGHRVRARISSPASSRAMILNMVVNCDEGTFTVEGQAELYEDGKLTDKVTPPGDVSSVKPARNDSLGAHLYDHYCKAG